MEYNIDFSRGQWNAYDFIQCGVYAIAHRKPFEQEDDCVTNGLAPGFFRADMTRMKQPGEERGSVVGMDHNDYAFTACVFDRELRAPFTLECDCAFEGFGSPSFTFGEKPVKDGDIYVYGSHVELTLWEEGINWWDIRLEPGNHIPTLLFHDKYTLAPGRHHVVIEYGRDKITGYVDGRLTSIDYNVPSTGYAGILGCEDMDRFYSLTLRED